MTRHFAATRLHADASPESPARRGPRMTLQAKHWIVARAIAALCLIAGNLFTLSSCGGGGSALPSPSAQTFTTSYTLMGPIAALTWGCSEFTSNVGNVGVSLTPPGPVELSTGGCSAPPTPVIAHSDRGDLNAPMPAGLNRVRFYNPSNEDTGFTLRVQYQM